MCGSAVFFCVSKKGVGEFHIFIHLCMYLFRLIEIVKILEDIAYINWLLLFSVYEQDPSHMNILSVSNYYFLLISLELREDLQQHFMELLSCEGTLKTF